MSKVRKNDTVIVIAGRDKGKQGKVLRVIPSQERAVVEGINLVKKHVKPNPNAGITGGIVERELSIHISNLAHYNPASKKADRVGYRILEDGRKVRYFKSNNELVDI